MAAYSKPAPEREAARRSRRRDGPAAPPASRRPCRGAPAPLHRPPSPQRRLWPSGRDNGDFVAHRVKDDHDRRTHEKRVRRADPVFLGRCQALHLAHHVIAEIAEDSRRHRRQPHGLRHGGFGDELTQGDERRRLAGREDARVVERGAIDFGSVADDAKNHVWVEADHRIAAAGGAAFDGFEQKSRAAPIARELEIGGDRRFEIGDQPGHDQLRPISVVFGAEGVEVGLEQRAAHLSRSAPVAASKAFWLISTPSAFSRPPTYCSSRSL